MNHVLLEDTFDFQTVPFVVKVEVQELYLNGKTGECRGVNIDKYPTGFTSSPPKEWVICQCVVARVRPDYPYTVDKEWPANVDKHFHVVVPLEQPLKTSGLLFSKWEAEQERTTDDVDVQKMASKAIEKMKTAYRDRTKVQH